MSTQLIFFCILFFAVCFIAVLFYLRFRQANQSLGACSEALQKIFKLMEETSSVTRILSQEPPEQELKRLEDLIVNQNQRAVSENDSFRGLINNFPDGVVAVNGNLSVVVCNLAFCRLMDVAQDEHQGKQLFQILRHHAALQAAEEFFQIGEKAAVEVEFCIKSEKWIKLKIIKTFNVRGITALLIVSDVSKIKQLENMRRDFVANVSHELRTPLTSIQGFMETLLEGASEDVDARRRFLELMSKDTDRLGRLISDLLVLSKIENQSHVFKKEKLSVSREAEEVMALFSLTLSKNKINFKKEVESNLEVYAHKDQFRQVLINILDNAVKFTPEDGVIFLSAKKFGNTGVEIRIMNSGPSVHPDNYEKIFQRFFREDKARSRDTGGTGLGLSIVKHVMETHHGRVSCQAGPEGKGTVFVLFFPVA